MPTEQELSTALLALKRISQLPPSTITSRVISRALLGWVDPEQLPPNDAQCVMGFVLTIRSCSAAALASAIRQRLAPRGTLADLERASATDWAMCKECYLGRLLVDADVPDAVLRLLADATRTCSRAQWAAAFGTSLRRKDRWCSFEQASRVVGLRRQVAAAGGDVAHLSTRQLLTLAQPVDTIGEGWGSALSYFAQNLLHFAEVYTDEGVRALATYLTTRQRELGSTHPVLEVGAGSGRLAFLLNATRLLSAPVIATEPLLDPAAGGGEAHGARFPVAQLDAESALRVHRPAIVLCAFMDFGSDWTEVFRTEGVRE